MLIWKILFLFYVCLQKLTKIPFKNVNQLKGFHKESQKTLEKITHILFLLWGMDTGAEGHFFWKQAI